MKLNAALCLSLICVARSRAEVAEPLLTSDLAALFGSSASIVEPRLSPDGSRLIVLSPDSNGLNQLRIVDFLSGQSSSFALVTDERLEYAECNWASIERVLCEVEERRTFRRNRVALMAFNADGSDENPIRLPCSGDIDWLPDDPEYIAVICPQGSSRVSLFNREVTELQASARGFDGMARSMSLAASDGHGYPRLAMSSRRRNREEWFVRNGPDDEWVRFFESDWVTLQDPLRPVGFGATLDELFHIAWSSETWSLFAMDLTSDFENRLVFSHPVIDVESVDTLGPYGRVVAAAYLDGRPQRYIVDARLAEVHAAVRRRLPEAGIQVVDESWDGEVYLLLARPPGRAGFYYLMDMSAEYLQPIGPEYAHLQDIELAQTQTLAIAGSDGGQFGAHLTLPRATEGPVPLVIMPRSGMPELDLLDPHYLVQFLTASGYAVLRVNQRGSDEYGAAWMAAKAVVGRERASRDLISGIQHLADRGLVDAQRVCAIGQRAGGYTALITAIEYPELLQCIIGIEAVIDPESFGGQPAYLTGNELNEASPIRRVKELQARVMLISEYGAQSQISYETRLRRADKDVRLIEYQNSRDDLSLTPHRIDMLVRIGRFLDETLK